jgi:hypothetical protein
MMLPGYTAESSIGTSRQTYRVTAAALSHAGLHLAQSEVFCGVCALGGFGCGKVCHSCGPFGLFECCDSICTEPAPGFTVPDVVLKG